MSLTQAAAGPGAIVAGRYRLLGLLGEGGMGQVFEAEHLDLGRRFALKLLHVDRHNPEILERFRREARAAAAVASPRVAQVTDFGLAEHLGPFYVMELVGGSTLEARIERQGPLPPEQLLSVAVDVADALVDVHRAGIIHRDLKPSNIGLQAEGPVRVKLLDFGLAARVDHSFLERLTRSQQVLGSLPYMAPEQFDGAAPSHQVDLYALGIVLYEAATGNLPFKAPTAAALIHHILTSPVPPLAFSAPTELPGGLEDLVHQLLAKDPLGRPRTTEEVAARLRSLNTRAGWINPATSPTEDALPAVPNRVRGSARWRDRGLSSRLCGPRRRHSTPQVGTIPSSGSESAAWCSEGALSPPGPSSRSTRRASTKSSATATPASRSRPILGMRSS